MADVSDFDVQLILCDAAQADPSGKVHMLGAGWSLTGSPTAPQAVAALIKIPWDRANEKVPFLIRLVDSDGQPVLLETDNGSSGIGHGGAFEVGRPPGLTPGTAIDHAFTINVPSLPLNPGRYQWRLEIADQVFATTFEVRADR